MLSRVADALYWMGRYVERAENVSRLLLVASELSVEMEGVDDRLAEAEWSDLWAIVRGYRGPHGQGGDSLSFLNSLLLDEDDPASVRHSLVRARENARSVREALTREVFSNLNEGFHQLERAGRRRIKDPALARQVVDRTHQDLLTTLGAMELTLSRDEGWTFLKLGEAIERTQRTLLVLRVKLPSLWTKPDDIDLPLFYARWRALLRSVASLENYRRSHGAGLVPEEVIRFLLLDPTTPRSVRCGISRMKNYLDALSPGNATRASRIVGRLLATLEYDGEEILDESDLSGYCDRTLAKLAAAHDAIAQHYFAA